MDNKYVEVFVCDGCGAVYLEDEGGCPNYCTKCDACKKTIKLGDLDEILLLEANAEICRKCADSFLYELAQHKKEDEEFILGDYKGRTT